MVGGGMSDYFGIYKGLCANNADPEGLGRVQAYVPQVFGDPSTLSTWALPSITPGDSVVLPNPGDSIWIMFEQGDEDYPVWFGGWLPSGGAL